MSVKIHIRVVGETHAGCSAPLLYRLHRNVEVSVRELTLTIFVYSTMSYQFAASHSRRILASASCVLNKLVRTTILRDRIKSIKDYLVCQVTQVRLELG